MLKLRKLHFQYVKYNITKHNKMILFFNCSKMILKPLKITYITNTYDIIWPIMSYVLHKLIIHEISKIGTLTRTKY
jgi:hypothetical protein